MVHSLDKKETILLSVLISFIAIIINIILSYALWWESGFTFFYWLGKALYIFSISLLVISIQGMGIKQALLTAFISILSLEIFYYFVTPADILNEGLWSNLKSSNLLRMLFHLFVILDGYFVAWLSYKTLLHTSNTNLALS